MEVASGQRIGQGRFEVLARIGEGGAGVVYEVRDLQSEARLALKTVRSAGPDALVSLKREFRAVQDIAHPNLVRLDELFEEDGAWFFTMELVDGTDWLSYVRDRNAKGSLKDDTRVRASLVQIVEALTVLHKQGTLHRDVKPSNVLVSKSGQVKLLDFGIASRARRGDAAAAEGMVGTVAYMSPEQMLAEESTIACDFYAVGVMLHQALTGELPYFDRTRNAMIEKVEGAPTPVHYVAPHASADLATLCDDLMRSDPLERPDAAAILRVLGEAERASSGELEAAREEFVGREIELAALVDSFAAVRAGGTVAIVVEGASGVGKSALVRHFLSSLPSDALVLSGRCHEREYVPYKGVDAIVDELAVLLENESDDGLMALSQPAMRLLPRLFPVLESVPFFRKLAAGSFAIGEGDAYELRARVFAAFRELIGSIAGRGPLVLAIDDVQWADADTLALLGDLLAPPSPPSLLLVCTRRLGEGEDERASMLPPIALPGDVRRVRVGGLSEGDIGALASRLSRDTRIDDDALRALVQESAGHPLFLQELMRRRARGSDTPQPLLRLDDALWSRVSLLGDAERRIVEAIAVAGLPTSLDLIATAATIPRPELAQHMATLRSANLVKVSGSGNTRRIEPYHDRVREAVVLHLDEPTRRRWHERLAYVLEESPERDVERLAVHWEAAGDGLRAGALFREAGERASNAFAFDRAVDLYRRALALVRADGIGRSTLEYSLADALFNAGRGGEAGRAFLALAGSGSDRAALDLRVRAASAFFGSGHFADGIEAIRTVITAVDLPFPEGRFTVIFMILWHRLMLRMRGLDLKKREPGSVSDRERHRFDVCTAAAFGIGMADTVRGAVFQHLAARLSLELGDPLRATRGLCGLALSMCTGGLKTAAPTAMAIAKARSLAKDLGDPYSDALIEAASGFAAYMLEDWNKACGHLATCERAFRDLRGVTYELATARMLVGRTLIQLGRLTDLDGYMGPALRDAIRRNDVYSMVNTRATVGALLSLAGDDVAAAENDTDEAHRAIAANRYTMQNLYCLNARCLIEAYRGRPEAILSELEVHAASLRAVAFDRVQSVRVMLVYLETRAHLDLARRKGDQRAMHLAAAEERARKLAGEGLPAAAALGVLTDAALASLAGDQTRTRDRLADALARFEKVSMGLHAAAAGHVLGNLVGGDEGKALTKVATERLDAQRIVNHGRFVALYAPGF